MRASRYRALRISTRWRSSTGMSRTTAEGSTGTPKRALTSLTSPTISARSSIPARAEREPSTTFSATVNVGTSAKCWWTMPTPRAMASAGDARRVGRPSISISPASGCRWPNAMFISVDLPAPFSPRTTWTSPARTSKSMSALATTAPNRFHIPRRASAGFGFGFGCCAEFGGDDIPDPDLGAGFGFGFGCSTEFGARLGHRHDRSRSPSAAAVAATRSRWPPSRFRRRRPRRRPDCRPRSRRGW